MTETENDKQDTIILLTNQLVDQACRVVALAKEKQTNIETVIYVDDEGNDVAVNVYDYKTVKMTSATTFDKLAQEEYGNPTFGTLISYYNKIQNEHKVEAGTTLRIPVLIKQDQNLLNRIYAVPEMQDNYGCDVALTDTGGFKTINGDFAVVKGSQNLHQAVGNRLTTASGKRIRFGAYGIRNSVGDPMAMNSYLMASIEQTMKEDPRITRVDEIEFEGKSDKLNITVTYTDINSNQDTFTGEV
jgi:phage baseplate assembly protein W